MFCEVTLLRRQGRRLKRTDLATPVRGQLRMAEIEQSPKVWPRAMRVLNLIQVNGLTSRTAIALVEPQFAGVTQDALCFKGIELENRSDGMYEHAQVWLVRPVPDADGSTAGQPWPGAVQPSAP